MAIQIGDSVRFLNQVGGGKVIRLLPKDQVLVMIEDGFELPVLISEVVVDNTAADKSQNGKKLPPEPQPFREQASINVLKRDLAYLAAVPADLDARQWTFYLINETRHDLYWAMYIDLAGVWEGIGTGMVRGESNMLLPQPVDSQLAVTRSVKLSGFFFGKGVLKHIGSFEANMSQKLLSASMLHLLKKDRTLDQLAHTVVLEGAASVWMEKEEDQAVLSGNLNVKEVSLSKDVKEVDLHIEALSESYQSLNATEIMRIQLAETRKQLEDCLFGKYKRLVLIHGVGAGVLKQEVIKIIKEYGFSYSDASLLRYGSGATEVYIK